MGLLTLFIVMAGFFVFIVSTPFDWRYRSLMHFIARVWAKSILFAVPFWRLNVSGLENIPPGKKPYVIVANHLSLIDILVLLSGLNRSFKFMAKKELFSVPFMGWHMALTGYIPVDRKSAQSSYAAMRKAMQWIRKGVSVVFFPEGTRSRSGQIQPFKIGAFKVAQEAGVMILPVVLYGTRDALPKKSWIIRRASRFHLSVGKPVEVQPGANHEEALLGLRDRIRKEMADRLDRLKQEDRHRK